jgi:hypothetical protein
MAAPLLAALREDATRCLCFAAACMAIAGLLAAAFFDEMPAEQRYSNHIALIITRLQWLC